MTTERVDGESKPWTRDDAEFFSDEEDHDCCETCGFPFQVGQMVQERPAMSLRFYHVSEKDCGK